VSTDVGAAEAPKRVERQGNVRAVSSFIENTDDHTVLKNDSETSNKLLWREAVLVRLATNWRAEFNAYNLLQATTTKTSPGYVLSHSTDETNRSPYLERHWHQSDAMDSWLTLDRANVRGSAAGFDLAVGRFPINLSVTSVFTPNDLFAPYRAHQFYREYKAGVDGVEVGRALGVLGRIAAYGVAGYTSESRFGRVGADGERRFAPELASGLVRAVKSVGGVEAGALIGRYGLYNMAGFSLQGEVFDTIGVRVEGHQKKHRRKTLASSEVAGGIDYRVAPPLLCQFEQFFHGSGYGSVDEYQQYNEDPDPPLYYVGKNYSAASAVYDVNPLVTWKNLFVTNWTDGSAMWSSNMAYALTEGAEVSASLLLPRGKGPKPEEIRSEYGTYPRIVQVETALYW
jgi:hypothetical protein